MIFTFLLAAVAISQAHPSVVHHKLHVRFEPTTHRIQAKDEITRPTAQEVYSFRLNANLRVNNSDAKKIGPGQWQIPLTQDRAIIEYEGEIFDAIVDDESRGLIAPQGITLFGGSQWYPQTADEQVTFELSAELPSGWSLVTQASSPSQPQEEIFLIAAPFLIFQTSPLNQVWLRQNDPELAKIYLDAMPGYIDHFSQLIAPYPYSEFKVVENFWETGFGMPSFALLGPTVIRLPFLIQSSLPHEILHNWWGNGVYVDYARGNWSEGLTTYQADHWQQVLAGKDSEYRRSTLAAFQDYVRTDQDFPLRKFTGRHSAGTQAIGYGKGMFLFHMLHVQLGDEVFHKGLQLFYKKNQFTAVAFEEIQQAFEEVTQRDLSLIFGQWLDRVGAPTVALLEPKAADNGVRFSLTQKSVRQQTYKLYVPIVLTYADQSTSREVVPLSEATQHYVFKRSQPITGLAIDPDFDVFRTLAEEEHPAALSQVLGANEAHFIKASDANDVRAFAKVWKENLSASDEVTPQEPPPGNGALIFLGSSPQAQALFAAALRDLDVEISDEAIRIEGHEYSRREHSIALVSKVKGQPMVWVIWPEGTDTTKLAKRLTHYGSMGAVIFKGEPNVLKKAWRIVHSPLSVKF